MKKTNLRLFLVIFLSCLTLATKATTIIWTNTAVGTAGDWNTAANWSPNQIPGAGDNVFITNNGTYTVGISDVTIDTVNNLTIGGTSGTQTLDVAGALVLNGTGIGNVNAVLVNTAPANAGGGGGNLNGTGTLTLAGQMTWLPSDVGSPGTAPITLSTIQTTNADITSGSAFTGGIWINTGTMLMTGPLSIGSSSIFSNAPSGTVSLTNIYTGQSTGFSGNGTVINAGLLLAWAPYGLDFITPLFINTGTVIDTNNDALTLSGGCTNTGSISIATGASVVTTNGVYVFALGSTVSGGGTFTITGTNATLAGTIACNLFSDRSTGMVTITGNMMAATNSFVGNATFTGGASLTNTFAVGSGTVNFNGIGAIQPSLVTMSGGTMAGTETVLDSGPFDWSAGTITGILQCDGGSISQATPGNACLLLGGELINLGTMTVQSTYNSGFATGNGGVVSNASAASFNFLNGADTLSAGTVSDGGSSIFYNAGTVTFTNTSSSTIPFTLTSLVNAGTVTVYTNATLTLQNGATNMGLISEGLLSGASLASGSFDFFGGSTFSVPNGFTFNINSGTAIFAGTLDVGGATSFESGTATFTGGGTFTNAVNVSGGTINFEGSNNLAGPVTFTSGTANFTGGGSLTSTVLFSGGTANFSGTGTMTPTLVTLNNGTLEGSQTLADSGAFNWNGGTLSGVVQCNGGTNAANQNFYGTLLNYGTFTLYGSIYNYGGHITNQALGTLNLASGFYTGAYSGTPNIDNDGQLNVTGPGSATINTPFNNAGSVAITGNGTLFLGNGGTESGSFSVASGSTLNFNGGTFAANGPGTISGAGNLTVSSGTANLGDTFGVTGTNTFSGGTANVTGAGSITSTLIISGGALNLNGTGTVTPAIVTISGGTEAGTQTVQDGGTLTWNGGIIYGAIQFVGGSTTGGQNLYGTLVNSGTFAWSGSIYNYGGHITNQASGTVNITSSSYTGAYSGTPTFDNDGQLNMAGPGSATINILLNNFGSVAVTGNGTLSLGDGGTGNGSFSVASGSTLNFAGGTFNANAPGAITGAGDLTVSSGTVNFAGSIGVTGTNTFSGGTANVTGAGNITTTLVISGGILNLNGTGTVTPSSVTLTGGQEAGTQTVQDSGLLNWTGGTTYGTIQFVGGTNSGGQNLYGTLVNSGTFTWNASIYNYGGHFTNLASGTVNLTSSSYTAAYSGTPTLDNEGQLNMSGPGTATINIAFNNSGTVAITGNGTFQLGNGGTEIGSFSIASGSALDFATGTFAVNGPGAISGPGNLTAGGGTVNVTNAGTFTAPLVISGGTLNLNGTNTVAPPSVTMSGGVENGAQTLQDSGTLSWTGGSIYGTIQFDGGSLTGGLNLYGALLNYGAFAWNGTIYYNGGQFTNLALGTVNLTSASSMNNQGGTPSFDNLGQVNMTGSGASTVNVPFNNTGAVAITGNSTLQLSDGGTETGPFSVASGSTLDFAGGTFALNGPGAISGAGNLTVGSGTVNVTGAGNFTSPLLISGGTLNLNGTNSVAPPSVTMSGGLENGAQTLQDSGTLSWSGGSIYGTIQFVGGSNSGGQNLYGTLLNSGAFAWNGAIYYNGGLFTNLALGTVNLASASSMNNQGGTPSFDNSGQVNMTGSGASTVNVPFNNTGAVAITGNSTLQLSGGGTETGPYSIASGSTLNFNGGTYALNGPGAISGAGNLTVSSGTVNITGAGNFTSPLVISGGTLNLNGTNTVAPPSVTMSGGVENGTQTLQDGGTLSWTGGSIYGTIQFVGGSNSGGQNLYGTLLNSGTFAWNGAIYCNGGLFTNLALGTVNLTSSSSMNNQGGTPSFDNLGQVNMTGSGTSTANVPFNNSGAVSITANGTLQLSGSGTETGPFSVASGSTLNFNGGTFALIGPGAISGVGNLIVGGGTINVTNAGTFTSPLVISGGTLNLNGTNTVMPPSVTMSSGLENGAQTLRDGGTLSWTGGSIYGTIQFVGGSNSGGQNLYGTLLNSGTFAWTGAIYCNGGLFTNLALGTVNLTSSSSMNNQGGNPSFDNSGQVNMTGPGTSTISVPFNNSGTLNLQSGVLSLTGPHSLTNGTLNFGITNVGNFGTLNLGGSANLTGTIELAFNGYTPLIGDSFNLITYGSETGAFTTPKLPPTINWSETYGPTVFNLTVAALNNPTNVTMVLASPLWAGNGFNFQVSGPIGSNYTVQVSTNLSHTWATLTNYISATNLQSISDSAASYVLPTNRFYRVKMH